ncbi:hypothetical protein DL769_009374 [Monosporascus sp. CRB-8-3]|nr:hypothetical protein DL769_009374 [Monosporascus sp. CRB-8-3]
MDRMLVELITARRAEAQAADEDDSGIPTFGGFVVQPSTADAGRQEKTIQDWLGKKHPNKRQQGELDRAPR